MWSLTCLLMGYYTFHSITFNSASPEQVFDTKVFSKTSKFNILRAYIGFLLCEATGFIFLGLAECADNIWVTRTGLSIQCIGGAMNAILCHYIVFRQDKRDIYYFWQHKEEHESLTWMIWLFLGVIVAILFVTFSCLGMKPWAMLTFLLWFEPPLVAQYLASWTMLCTHKGEVQRNALVWCLSWTILYGVHLWTVAVKVRPEYATEWDTFLQRAMSIPGIMGGTYVLKELTNIGVFQRQEPTTNNVKADKKWHSGFASPEHFWSFGGIVITVGYVISGICMAMITKPDLGENAIFKMYATYHPCILLDYLPGTIFAQPIFTLGLVMMQISVGLQMIRAVLTRRVDLIFIWAFTCVFYSVISTLFELVFTFNPLRTGVLQHSVPDMFLGLSAILICGASIYTVCYWEGNLEVSRKIIAIACCGAYILTATYGLLFMFKCLGWVDHHMSINDKPPDFDFLPMTAAIILQMILYTMGMVSPLRTYPLTFEWLVTNAKTDVATTDVEDTSKEEFRLTIKPMRYLGLAGVCFACAIFPLAYYVNYLRHTKAEQQDWILHDYLIKYPGSAVTAVGWVVMVQLMVCHSFGLLVHTWHCEEKGAMFWITNIVGSLLVPSALFAHANTIPRVQEEATWYYGDKFYLFVTSIWILVLSWWAFQSKTEHNQCRCAAQVVVGVVCAVICMLCVFKTSNMLLLSGAAITIVVFCFIDVVGVKIHVRNIKQAKPTEHGLAYYGYYDEGNMGLDGFTALRNMLPSA